MQCTFFSYLSRPLGVNSPPAFPINTDMPSLSAAASALASLFHLLEIWE